MHSLDRWYNCQWKNDQLSLMCVCVCEICSGNQLIMGNWFSCSLSLCMCMYVCVCVCVFVPLTGYFCWQTRWQWQEQLLTVGNFPAPSGPLPPHQCPTINTAPNYMCLEVHTSLKKAEADGISCIWTWEDGVIMTPMSMREMWRVNILYYYYYF